MQSDGVKKHTPKATLNVGWLLPVIYYGLAVVVIFYVRPIHDIPSALRDWRLLLTILVAAETLTNVSETKFILLEHELQIKKPFFPFVFDKTFALETLSKVECQYTTGKTLQPSIVLYFKDGKRKEWFTTASTKSVKGFLDQVESLGVRTNFNRGKRFET